MKNSLGIVLLSALVMQAAPALAASPFFGKWAVDVTRLPIPPEARPKSVTFTFSDGGEDKWRTQVDIVAPDGTATHGAATYPLDGTAAPVSGSPEADLSAARSPAANVLILALSKSGVPGSIRIYTIDPGGSTMTETATYFGKDGAPVMRINHFTRVR